MAGDTPGTEDLDSEDLAVVLDDPSLYPHVLDALSEGVVVLDQQGRPCGYNRRVAEILHVTPADIGGMEAFDPRWSLVDLDGRPIEGDELPSLLALTGDAPQEDQVVGLARPDGSRAWVTGRAVPLRPRPDEPPKAVLYSFRDVTAEVEAQRARAAAERRFREFFDGAPNGLAMVELDGAWRDVNPALCELLGYAADDLRGRPFHAVVHPDDATADANVAVQIRSGEVPAERMDTRLVTRDGRVIWTSLRRSVVRDGDEGPGYLLVQVTDVTERHLLVTSLRNRLATLEELNEALGDFAGRASHDLKSPLTAIGGFATMLRERWQEIDDESREEILDRVALATARAAAMVTDLLADAQRSTSGGDAIPSTDPRGVLHVAVSSLSFPEAELTVSGDWPPVAVGVADLRSVFANLLVNALHHGRDDHGRLRLRVHGEVEGGRLILTFADDGPGLPDPELVFEPGYRQPPGMRPDLDSTGLGLALVRRAVDRWGGSVTGGTSDSGGAEIRLVLPLG